MKVHLIKKQTIEDYTTHNAASRASFIIWLQLLKYADWATPSDIQATFSTADLLGAGSNRVVFDIGGNNYRLIAKYAFGEKHVHLFVCWIGTHSQYSKLCKQNKQFDINSY